MRGTHRIAPKSSVLFLLALIIGVCSQGMSGQIVSLLQFTDTGEEIGVGGGTDSSTIYFSIELREPLSPNGNCICVVIEKLDEADDKQVTESRHVFLPCSSDEHLLHTASVSGLEEGSYCWRVQLLGNSASGEPWVEYGGNGTLDVDFMILDTWRGLFWEYENTWVSRVEPDHGSPGEKVRVYGRFSPTQEPIIFFDGQVAQVIAATEEMATVIIPIPFYGKDGDTDVYVSLSLNAAGRDPDGLLRFTYKSPRIASMKLDPSADQPRIVITGQDFGYRCVDRSTGWGMSSCGPNETLLRGTFAPAPAVEFAATTCEVLSWTPSRIVVKFPDDYGAGMNDIDSMLGSIKALRDAKSLADALRILAGGEAIKIPFANAVSLGLKIGWGVLEPGPAGEMVGLQVGEITVVTSIGSDTGQLLYYVYPPVTNQLAIVTDLETNQIVQGLTVQGHDVSGNKLVVRELDDGAFSLTGYPGWWKLRVDSDDGLVGFYDVEGWLGRIHICEDERENSALDNADTPQSLVSVALVLHADDLQGPPLERGLVQFQDGGEVLRTSFTTEDGLAVLVGDPGHWRFTAWKQGYVAKSWSAEIGGGERVAQFLEADGTPVKDVHLASLSLRVVDAADNAPIDGASVVATDGQGHSIAGETDPLGMVILAGMPGTWELEAAHSEYFGLLWSQLASDDHVAQISMIPALPRAALVSITVEGPSEIGEESATAFRCIGDYSDGSSQDLSMEVSWAVQPTGHGVIEVGVLTVGNVNADRTCEIVAEYSQGEETWTTRKAVVLRNTTQEAGPSEITLDVYVFDSSINGYPPIAGATISGQEGSGNDFTAVTDASGHAQISGGTWRWYFDVSAEGYCTYTWNGTTVFDEDAEHRAGLIPIPAIATLDVYVYEDDSLAQLVTTGASVHVEGPAGESINRTTNTQGFATIAAAQGDWVFTISKDGYDTTTWRQIIYPDTGRVDLWLGGVDHTFIALIHLHEDDLDGAPIPGARVQGSDEAGNHFDATTDSSGVAELAGEEGIWSLRATREGFGSSSWSVMFYAWSDPDVHHALEKYITWMSRTVWIHSGTTSGPEIPGAGITFVDGARNESHVNANSHGFWSLRGIPGTWTIEASAGGHQSTEWTGEVLEDVGSRDIHIALTPETWPNTPTGLSASDDECGAISLTWSSQGDADSYEIYRSVNSSHGFEQIATATAARYDDAGVATGTTYYYEVSACNAYGCSDPSSRDSGALAERIGTPMGVEASDDQDNQVTIGWNSVVGASEYRIQRSSSADGSYSSLWTSTTTSVVDLGGDPGVRYYYRVLACSECGCGEPSESDEGTALGAIPARVTGVAASDGAHCGKVSISWQAVPGATFYQVSRSLASAQTYTGVEEVASSRTSTEDTSAEPGALYDYRVRACNSGRCGDFSASDRGSRIGMPISGSQDIGTSTGCGVVVLTWPAVEGATSYEVHRSTSSGGSYSHIGTSLTPSYDDTTALPSVQYRYKVQPCNGCGCGDLFGGSTGRAEAAPPVPGNVEASSSICDMIEVDWDGPSNQCTYEIFRSTNRLSGYQQLGTRTAPGYQDYASTEANTAQPGVTYYYKVRAVDNQCGAGEFSDPAAGVAPGPVPSAPTGVAATDGVWGDQIEVTWNAASNATRYTIMVAEDPDGRYADVGRSTSTSYMFRSVVPGTVYYFKIRAYHDCGGGCLFGPDSNYDSGYGGS